MWRFVSLIVSLALLAGVVTQDATPAGVTTLEAGPTAEVSPEPPNSCANLPLEDCPPLEKLEDPRCRGIGEHVVFCCNIRNMFELKEQVSGANVSIIKSLHVRNATLPELDASFTSIHQSLERLSVTDGNVTKIIGQFHPSITCLNLSGNVLGSIDDRALIPLKKLTNLDISRNNLTRMPALNVAVDAFWLDISGANELQCTIIVDFKSKMTNDSHQLHFLNKNNTFCILLTSFNWFHDFTKVAWTQVEQGSKFQSNDGCPRGKTSMCSCDVHRVDYDKNSVPTYSIAVDCAGQQLTELPEKLPLNTVVLNVSNNNISNLSRLFSNTTGYGKIRQFIGDNNQISSIELLEGSDFLHRFVYLSIRYNNLDTIPTYILSSRFDRNDIVAGSVKLGGNRIFCDCDTVQLKNWLESNGKNVPDYREVQCKDIDLKVIDLDPSQVCVSKHKWTDYISYIIAGEVVLLIMLVGKVSYDYWVFKTAGYLPWPASKMPKLPCDWVFET